MYSVFTSCIEDDILAQSSTILDLCSIIEIFIQREIKKNTFDRISNFNPLVRLHVHFQSLLTVEGPAAIVGVTFDQLRRPLHDMRKFYHKDLILALNKR